MSCGRGEEAYFTPKKKFQQTVKVDVEEGMREGVKAVSEQVLHEETTEHLKASYQKLTVDLEWRVQRTDTTSATSSP